MVNLKKSFEETAAEMGDKLLSAVVGWHDNDSAKYSDYSKRFPVEPWEEARKKLDYEYSNGFGGADCHAVVAWGERFVYFVHEYDGATGINCVPRNPEPCAPEWADIDHSRDGDLRE